MRQTRPHASRPALPLFKRVDRLPLFAQLVERDHAVTTSSLAEAAGISANTANQWLVQAEFRDEIERVEQGVYTLPGHPYDEMKFAEAAIARRIPKKHALAAMTGVDAAPSACASPAAPLAAESSPSSHRRPEPHPIDASPASLGGGAAISEAR